MARRKSAAPSSLPAAAVPAVDTEDERAKAIGAALGLVSLSDSSSSSSTVSSPAQVWRLLERTTWKNTLCAEEKEVRVGARSWHKRGTSQQCIPLPELIRNGASTWLLGVHAALVPYSCAARSWRRGRIWQPTKCDVFRS